MTVSYYFWKSLRRKGNCLTWVFFVLLPLVSLAFPIVPRTITLRSALLYSTAESLSSNQSPNQGSNNNNYNNHHHSFISPEEIQSLLDSIDLVSALETYNLDAFVRTSNGGAKCICPFHNDHNPSMSIDPVRQIYKCFSCGAGGNLITFVREYARVQQGQELTFVQAVRHLQNDFGGNHRSSVTNRTTTTTTTLSKHARDRILRTNLLAAAYFEDSLQSPAAGKARQHLRRRQLKASTVKAFSMGFATGRLVEELLVLHQDKNVTTDDLVAAGLAREKNGRVHDRFRGRLMVPIWNGDGSQVLGFGGRRLVDQDKSPKYMNSPETPVFKKQSLLFGADKLKHDDQVVTIVEGYMDMISLWQAGVSGVVASMGTAISLDQMFLAASRPATQTLVLCLDQDEAGVQAVERLCKPTRAKHSMLQQIEKKYPVQILVATLPDGVKDPDECLGLYPMVQAADRFREEVLDCATPWGDWYSQRIIASYNATDDKSLAHVVEQLAEYLAGNGGDRKKGAEELVESLEAPMNNKLSMTTKMQVEAQLTQKAAKIADTKLTLANGGQLTSADARVASVVLGSGMSGTEETDQLSWKAQRSFLSRAQNEADNSRNETNWRSRRSLKSDGGEKLRKRKRVPTFTPHFSGFSLNRNDARWLGLINHQGRRDETLLLPANVADEYGKLNELGQKRLLYFNSNEYHGNRFLTEEAMAAGYKNEGILRDPSFLQKGLGSLLKIREDRMFSATEDNLLRTLLLFPSGRRSLNSTLSLRQTSGSHDSIVWSSPDKAWLFFCLVEDHESIPNTLSCVEDLHRYLSSRPDAVPGAIGGSLLEDPSGFSPIDGGVDDAGIFAEKANESHQTSEPNPAILVEFVEPSPVNHSVPPEVNCSTLRNGQSLSAVPVNGRREPLWTNDRKAEAKTLDISGVEVVRPIANCFENHASKGTASSANETQPIHFPMDSEADVWKDGVLVAGAAVAVLDNHDEMLTSSGNLDYLFHSGYEAIPSLFDSFIPKDENTIAADEQGELAIQEMYSFLAMISSLTTLSAMRKQLASVESILNEIQEDRPGLNSTSIVLKEDHRGETRSSFLPNEDIQVDPYKRAIVETDSAANMKLESLFQEHPALSYLRLEQNGTVVLARLTEHHAILKDDVVGKAEDLHDLMLSHKSVADRLLEYASTGGQSSGKVSLSQHRSIQKTLKSHLQEVNDWSVPGDHHDDDVASKEMHYEDFLEGLVEEWDELYNEDYGWGPHDIEAAAEADSEIIDRSFMTIARGEGDEFPDDMELRMDAEWAWTNSSSV